MSWLSTLGFLALLALVVVSSVVGLRERHRQRRRQVQRQRRIRHEQFVTEWRVQRLTRAAFDAMLRQARSDGRPPEPPWPGETR